MPLSVLYPKFLFFILPIINYSFSLSQYLQGFPGYNSPVYILLYSGDVPGL